jgi:hypothetical protein
LLQGARVIEQHLAGLRAVGSLDGQCGQAVVDRHAVDGAVDHVDAPDRLARDAAQHVDPDDTSDPERVGAVVVGHDLGLLAGEVGLMRELPDALHGHLGRLRCRSVHQSERGGPKRKHAGDRIQSEAKVRHVAVPVKVKAGENGVVS